MRYILLIFLLFLILSGCSTAPKEEPIIKDRIVYRVKEVYIPVPCDVKVTCDFKGKGYQPTMKLLECVVKQKRALEYCKQKKGDEHDRHQD